MRERTKSEEKETRSTITMCTSTAWVESGRVREDTRVVRTQEEAGIKERIVRGNFFKIEVKFRYDLVMSARAAIPRQSKLRPYATRLATRPWDCQYGGQNGSGACPNCSGPPAKSAAKFFAPAILAVSDCWSLGMQRRLQAVFPTVFPLSASSSPSLSFILLMYLSLHPSFFVFSSPFSASFPGTHPFLNVHTI